MSDGEINVDSIDGEVLTTANIVGQLYPQGEKGDKGDRGDDGFSPTVETSKVGKTTTITITDADGVHTATILDGADGQGSGDMRTEVYDINHNGIVDDAEKVNGHTVGTDVPADAVFTDTTYTAGTGIDITGNVITNTQTSAEWGNITGTLSDQTDLKDALDSKANTSAVPTKVSDLNNDSGFIDKDVNNLTNYDTSTTVDTKISNSEEVLIGSDSGIKASHELWVDTSDVTPYVNSEISNEYGTAQNLGYSQNYANNNFASTDLATGSRNGLMSSADFTKLGAMAINNTYGTSSTEAYSQSYVNNLTTYSTTETRIGTWIDGKPLYRKVCSSTSITLNTQVLLETIPNVKEIAKISGIIYSSSGFTAPIPTIWNNDVNTRNSFMWVDVGSNSASVKYQIGSGWASSTKITIVLEYTKTTD